MLPSAILTMAKGHPLQSSSFSTMYAEIILISCVGLSSRSVWVIPKLLTILIPSETLPNIVCFPSSHGVGARVMKNCLTISTRPTYDQSCSTYLATIRIGPAVRHAQYSSSRVLQVRLDLVLELLAINGTSASSSASRVTALDHEIWDHTVENEAVVVAALSELREVFACLWRMLFV